MGVAWDNFAKLAADAKVMVEVKLQDPATPGWVWVVVAVAVCLLYAISSGIVAYRQGRRGCALAQHTLTALAMAIVSLLMRMGTNGNTPHHRHSHPTSPSGSSVSTLV